MQHIIGHENIALIANRQTAREEFSFAGVTNLVCCHGTFYLGNRGQDYCFPLYLFPTEQDLDRSRRVNFDMELYSRLQKVAEHPERGIPNELAAFDYIYGVLHCPEYRSVYAEFLKMDFPHIPWPATSTEFWDVSDKGNCLRRLHLMESQAIGATHFPFRGDGDGVVRKFRFDGNKVWINDTQFFDDVPEISWSLFIGGYQPAQKWLKDRAGYYLSFAEVSHYQRILKILCETDRIVATITMKLD